MLTRGSRRAVAQLQAVLATDVEATKYASGLGSRVLRKTQQFLTMQCLQACASFQCGSC